MRDYFPESDFENANPPCKKSDMCPIFLAKLNKARIFSEVPYVINSAARTRQHELNMGRPGDSAHVFTATRKSQAVDISAITDEQRARIIIGLVEAGFERIGIAKTYVHADNATPPFKNAPRVWLYS